MKKIYMTPSLKVKEIKVQHILAGSGNEEVTTIKETPSEYGAKESTWGNTWDSADE